MIDSANDQGIAARTRLESRIRDAQIERDKHEQQWNVNTLLYHGAHKSVFAPESTKNYFVSNHIQNVVIIKAAVMTETPPRPLFVGREANEPPEIFLSPESQYKVPEGSGLTDQQMMGAEVIPEALFDMLASYTVKQNQPNPRAGETVGAGENAEVQPDEIEVDVPVFTNADFIFVDDKLCAEALTQEHNSEWEMCGGDEELRQCIVQSSVIGHQDILVQWNTQDNRFEIVKLYPYSCWIDRWCTSTRDAEYFVLREVMPVAEALREFPEHANEIHRNKKSSIAVQSFGGSIGGKYTATGDRDIVEIFTMWERHFPMPMDAEQALQQGLIEVAVEEPLVDPDTNEIVDLGGTPMVTDDGQPQFILKETGEATAPDNDNWPKRYGILQTKMLGQAVLFEGETEFADIPVARIRNIPIIESPYAQGEPQRLAGLQDLQNRLWSIYYDYCKFYRSPMQAMPQSVMNDMEDIMKIAHSSAGMKLGVKDDLWTMFGGNILQTVPIPQITDTFFNLLQMIKNEMNEVGGTSDVLRGNAKSEWSGELFAQATNAARGPIGFTARGVSEGLKHLAKITSGLILDFLPLDEWVKRNKKYPPQVLEVMRTRLKRIGYDVAVEVGGASSREMEASKLSTIMMNNPRLTTSQTFMRQLLDRLGVKEGEKIVEEIQQAAMQMAAPQA